MDPEGGQGVRNPPEKSQVAIGFLRNPDMELPREALGPLGSTIASRGRSVLP